jgi:PD-(D/E)XK nuclease superfamily
MVFKSWSNSALATLQVCGEKFRRRYIEGDRRFSGLAAKRGITVHKIALEAHKQQMADRGEYNDPVLLTEKLGTPRVVEEAKDLAATAFDKEIKEGVTFKPEEKIDTKVFTAGAKQAAVDMSGYYVKKVAPPVFPVAVERKIVVKPQDADISITGYLDLIEGELSPTGTVKDIIRDLKTVEKAPRDDAAHISGQLTMYYLIRRAETHQMPKSAKLVHLVRTPVKRQMSTIVQETTRDDEDLKRMVARINVAVDAVKKGVFVPADPSVPGSPCSWCDYRDDCVYVRRRT